MDPVVKTLLIDIDEHLDEVIEDFDELLDKLEGGDME